MSINQRTGTTNFLYSLPGAEIQAQAGELYTREWVISPHSTFNKIEEEIMTMVDGSSNQLLDFSGEMEETRMASDSSDNSLGAFLARPIKIYSNDWTPGTAFNIDLDPWNAFFNNKRVINRINNYKLFRGRMKIKIVINGNSFFYGRLMVSYLPLIGFDTMTQNTANVLTLIQHSQMPRVFLDPTTSQGAEMTLPFFWHNDYLDIIGIDYQNMGYLRIKQLNALKHTSGDITADTRASVSIFAWMEDVHLEAPTSTNNINIVAQSTPPKDFIASRIIPHSSGISAPYATGGSSKAKDSDPQYVTPRGVASTMQTDVPDSSNKLTLTSGQQLSHDPRILGLGPEDEMSIKYVAGKESYLTSFNWLMAANRESLLFNIRATPAHYGCLNIGTPLKDTFQFTACCGAVLPFRYWNGTFKVRFQIVGSAFHRGRIAIVYDPEKTATVREDNVAYTQIVDISTCRDVTFEVGPNQDRTMLTYSPPTTLATDTIYGTTPLGFTTTGNGTIAVYVLNELTLPNATPGINNNIQINVFVSMADDFQVFVPSSNFADYQIFPQSTGVDVITTEVDPVQDSIIDGGPVLSLDQPNAVSSKRHLVYVGEDITCFRQMLKRYYPWAGVLTGVAASNVPTVCNFTHKSFPGYRGAYAGAPHSAVTIGAYAFFGTTLLNYLTPAYQAWRGAIRYKVLPRSMPATSGTNGISTVGDANATGYTLSTTPIAISSAGSASRSLIYDGAHGSRQRGTLVVVQSVNPAIEYEIPWWEPMRFCPGKVKDWTTVTSGRNIPGKGAALQIDHSNPVVGVYDVRVSAGDDFGLYCFTGWPVMYYVPTPPAAV